MGKSAFIFTWIILSAASLIAQNGIRNVRDFGAAGDGIQDDRSAIQATIDSLPHGGGLVYLPEGKYLIKSAVYLRRGVRLEGASRRSARVVGDQGVKMLIGVDPASVGGEQDITVAHLGFSPLDPAATAIDFDGITQSRIEDVAISTWTLDGTVTYRSDGTVGIKLAANGRSGYSNVVRDVRIENLGTGIAIKDTGNKQMIENADISNSTWAIWIEGDVAHVTIQNCRLETLAQAGVTIRGGPRNIVIAGNYFEDMPIGIQYAPSTDAPVVRDNFNSSVSQPIQINSEGTPVAVMLTADQPNVIKAGTTVTWTATIIGANPSDYLYEWWYAKGTEGWSIYRTYSPSNRLSMSLGGADVGYSRIGLTVKKSTSLLDRDMATSVPIQVTQ